MERSKPSKETSLLRRGVGAGISVRERAAGRRGGTQRTGCMEAPSAPVWARLPVCRYHFVRAALGPAGRVQACSWTCSSGGPNSLDSLALGDEQMPYYKWVALCCPLPQALCGPTHTSLVCRKGDPGLPRIEMPPSSSPPPTPAPPAPRRAPRLPHRLLTPVILFPPDLVCTNSSQRAQSRL